MFKREWSIRGGGSTSTASSKVGDIAKDIVPVSQDSGGGEISLGAADGGGIPSPAWYSTITTSSSLWLLLGLSLATGIATGIIVASRTRRKQISKDFGAFVKYLELHPPPQPAPPIAPHPLTGLKFSIKDVFDVEGFVTGFGSPEWEKTHEAASLTAFSVAVLVQSGATCTAKTHMDEMALSISGQNKHYPLLINPAAPAHSPGGSSGGSAVAVAADLVDFSLGTDTCGDVRIPAAYCGVLGFRPSHGAISYTGVLPVSQSLDTVGWFAGYPDVLHKVGRVLLKPSLSDLKQPRRIFIADDCFSLLSGAEKRHLLVATSAIEKVFGKVAIIRMKLGEYFASKMPSLKMSLVCFRVDGERGKAERGFSALKSLSDACQLLKGHEFKLNHEEWVLNVMLTSSTGIPNHVKVALEAKSELVSESLKLRNEARTAMSDLLLNDGVLVIPSVSGPPSKLRSKTSLRGEVEERTLTLASIASMSGCCEVSIPMGTHNGCPSAISLIGKHGADHLLLHATDVLFPVLQKEAEEYANVDHEEDDKETPRPEAAEAAKEKGNEAFKRKDFKAAVLSYSEAIRCDEDNATYHSNRAAAYLALQNFPLAETDCSRAIELDRKNVKAYMRRATARERLGCYKEADEDFRQALVLEPTNKTAADGIKRVRKLLYE